MSKEADFSFVEDTFGNFVAKGHVNFNNSEYMQRKLDERLRSSSGSIAIDMSQVTFFSSAGVKVVLSTHKKLKAKGSKLRISSPSEVVRNVIGMAALGELLL